MIFIGHSLGGLLIKEVCSTRGLKLTDVQINGLTQALALAISNREDTESLNLFRSAYGLIFFGVPNLGLRNEQLRGMVDGQPNEQLVHDLQVMENSEPTPFLRELGQKFIGACKEQKPEFKIISYYEQRMSPTVEVSVSWTRVSPC